MSRWRFLAALFGITLSLAEVELNFKIHYTYDGRPIDHIPTEILLSRSPLEQTGDLEVKIFSTSNRTQQPSGSPGEPFMNLWEYEAVALFLINEEGQYIEIELGPYGHHLVFLLYHERETYRHSLPLEYTSVRDETTWNATAYIPKDYLPPKITKFNAFHLRNSASEDGIEALYPDFFRTKAAPDIHALNLAQPIDLTSILPTNSQDKPSRLWKDAVQGILRYHVASSAEELNQNPDELTLQGLLNGTELNFTTSSSTSDFVFHFINKEGYVLELLISFHSPRLVSARLLSKDSGTVLDSLPVSSVLFKNVPTEKERVLASPLISSEYFPKSVQKMRIFKEKEEEKLLVVPVGYTPRRYFRSLSVPDTIDFEFLLSADAESTLWISARSAELDPTHRHSDQPPDSNLAVVNTDVAGALSQETLHTLSQSADVSETLVLTTTPAMNSETEEVQADYFSYEEQLQTTSSSLDTETATGEDILVLPTTVTAVEEGETTAVAKDDLEQSKMEGQTGNVPVNLKAESHANQPNFLPILEQRPKLKEWHPTPRPSRVDLWTTDIPPFFDNAFYDEFNSYDYPLPFNPGKIEDIQRKGDTAFIPFDQPPLPMLPSVMSLFPDINGKPNANLDSSKYADILENILRHFDQKNVVPKPVKVDLDVTDTIFPFDSNKEEVKPFPSENQGLSLGSKDNEGNDYGNIFKVTVTDSPSSFSSSVTVPEKAIDSPKVDEAGFSSSVTVPEKAIDSPKVDEAETRSVSLKVSEEEITDLNLSEIPEASTDPVETTTLSLQEILERILGRIPAEKSTDNEAIKVENISLIPDGVSQMDKLHQQEADSTRPTDVSGLNSSDRSDPAQVTSAQSKSELATLVQHVDFKVEKKDTVKDKLQAHAEQETPLPGVSEERISDLELTDKPGIAGPNEEDYPYTDYLDPALAQYDEPLPPPHPFCFYQGLIPDLNRCQIFYECILEEGQWLVYNWRCQRGLRYDPNSVACVPGYC